MGHLLILSGLYRDGGLDRDSIVAKNATVQNETALVEPEYS